MATTFLEPGGDADFLVGTTNGFWGSLIGAPAIATDFIHGNHIKSIKYNPGGGGDSVTTLGSVLSDAGSRISLYIYIVALPTAIDTIISLRNSANTQLVNVRITSGGILQIWNAITAQIGSNGATLSLGRWYRISLAYTITSTSVNRFELFVDGVPSVSVTNATVTTIITDRLRVGNANSDNTLDFRSSDHYVDNSSSLTDTGNVWVTAKRPFANGTTNGFSTQVGAGGSGYGSGHSPQVNERPLSVTNSWSMIGAGSAVTEEYNIENASTGDINIASYNLVDYLGWVSAKAALSETGNIIVNNVTSNIALTSTDTLFTKIAGSTAYPAGTGTDIGIVTSTTVTTVTLNECGMIFAYLVNNTINLPLLGVG